ncbi:biofilm regulation protein kinase SiaB [Thauera chlorobenzoica]|uniref:Uncharacterized protein n=1 Tax=Thauera chlorobenzoica TaxID=96773 RepID=A0A1H5Y8J8_9RHOO|nr:biofilm regulation protein kinase SiaB [Thauera chlorobenzoica]APR04307.1 hypothetical protein Tchl_1448 [Thauera chlorobenzoica]SEG20343.1 hypothetical protein SAMN05216242_1255 [Thauera chlorobenzoica]
MDDLDLFSLRDLFNRNRILLCFNGPISRSLIEEIGHALKNYLQAQNATPSAAMDVFGVYIEMTQNIRHYAAHRQYGEEDSAATIIVARQPDGAYLVQAGNLVEADDGPLLMARIKALSGMDKAELKSAYKEQLRKPRDTALSSGAGLGLLDIARKACQPLSASVGPASGGKVFFSLRAVI